VSPASGELPLHRVGHLLGKLETILELPDFPEVSDFSDTTSQRWRELL
jgi:hypothetical protein